MYIGIIVILLMALITVMVTLLLYSRQLSKLTKQIELIHKQDTNIQLMNDLLPIKSIQELTLNINTLLSSHRELELALIKSNRQFKDTITNISHDLRTPLTSANGYVQMLAKEDLPKDRRDQYIAIIEGRIAVLKSMLDQLFEYARIESNEVEVALCKISVSTILENTISHYYEDFNRKDIQLTLAFSDKQLYINGNEMALTRILQNVIQNADIHGEGKIEISSQENNNNCHITIKNKARGIEQADMEHIFDRFYTTDKSRTRKTTGLGLSIAQKFVLKMNGKIEAKLENKIFSIRIIFPLITS